MLRHLVHGAVPKKLRLFASLSSPSRTRRQATERDGYHGCAADAVTLRLRFTPAPMHHSGTWYLDAAAAALAPVEISRVLPFLAAHVSQCPSRPLPRLRSFVPRSRCCPQGLSASVGGGNGHVETTFRWSLAARVVVKEIPTSERQRMALRRNKTREARVDDASCPRRGKRPLLLRDWLTTGRGFAVSCSRLAHRT